MSTNSAKAVKEWRKNTKLKLITCMGSKCQICGYSKCTDALEFHHINPKEKDFALGAIRANPTNWLKITKEVSKCILVCSNCHKEIHADLIDIPKNYQTFDETILQLPENKYLLKQTKTTYCPVCNKEKENSNKTCSKECAGKYRSDIDWSQIDLIDLIENQKKTKTSIAEELNCSRAMVIKKYKQCRHLAGSSRAI